MKYIIMAGGSYEKFKIPKQLLKVNGEVIIERTIRLLRENGIKDIAISTNNPAFDYLDVEKLRHENNYSYTDSNRNKRSNNSWLNAYYPMKEPCCYLHGDVYFSENAIKTIVETEVKDTMFFCVPDLQDGMPRGVNPKGREPLAYKVNNQKVFRKAINDIFKMIDKGMYKDGIEPISWHLYRKLNNLDMKVNAKWYDANDIFKTNGDYIPIYDYTTDIDDIKDIEKIERFIELAKGGENMVKVIVLEDFYYGKFKELKNIERFNKLKNVEGYLYEKDTFECEEETAEYLGNEKGHENSGNRAFVKVIDKPKKEEPKEVIEEKATCQENLQVEEKPKKVTRRRKSVAKK